MSLRTGASRLLLVLSFVLGVAATVGCVSAAGATEVVVPTRAGTALDCSQGALGRGDAVRQLREVRASINRSLRLIDAGRRAAAFREARGGYLQCFEAVEAPLDVTAGVQFRFEVEDAFARVRGLIQSGAPTGEVRDRIVTLRGYIDETERRLTAPGIGAPLLVFGQSFTLLFREGLEAVLLLSVLLAYLESTKHRQYRAPILYGVGAAILATIVTYFAVDALFSVLPFGREVLEAAVGLVAVATLFYVSFWLIARLDQRRWLEFLKARVFTAVSAGSLFTLALIGFTSVYREGFETVLFYQAMTSFNQGLRVWVWVGVVVAALALAAVAITVIRLGRRLPIRSFLAVAIVIVMASSVAMLGNSMRALQEAAVIDLRILDGWPSLPIYLAQATGYYPTVASVLAQAALIVVYAVGGVYVFVVRPKRRARKAAQVQSNDGAIAQVAADA